MMSKAFHKLMQFVNISALVVVCACLFSAQVAAQQPKLPTEPVIMVTNKGQFTFVTEIANDDRSRNIGLMFREHMGRREAMMFQWRTQRPIAMWMENTPLSLDMIFVDRRGRVVNIARNTIPFSRDIIESRKPVVAVIEVLAGTADEIGLNIGDSIKHMMFN